MIFAKLQRISYSSTIYFQTIPFIVVQAANFGTVLTRVCCAVNLVLLVCSWRYIQEDTQDLEYCRTMVSSVRQSLGEVNWLSKQSQVIEIRDNPLQLCLLANIQDCYALNILKLDLSFRACTRQLDELLSYCQEFMHKLYNLQSLRLDFKNSEFSDAHLQRLQAILLKIALSPLRFCLNLQNCRASAAFISGAVASLRRFDKLVNLKLVLADNSLHRDATQKVIAALGALNELSELHLDLSFNVIDLAEIGDAFANMPYLRNLHLYFRSGALHEEDVTIFFDDLSNTSTLQVLTLDLSENDLDLECFRSVARVLANNQDIFKLVLDLTATNMDNQALQDLITPLCDLRTLSFLSLLLSRNPIQPGGEDQIAKLLMKNQHISHLDLALEELNWKDDGIQTISNALIQQKNLHYLKFDLRQQGITDHGATYLLKAIQFQQKRFLTKYDIDLK